MRSRWILPAICVHAKAHGRGAAPEARVELERSGLPNTVGGYLASARDVIPDRGDLEAKAKGLFQGKTE